MERKIEKSGWNAWTKNLLQLLLLVLALPSAAFCATVVLEWDPSTDADIAGYKVYYQAGSAVLPFAGVGAAEGSAPVDVAKVNSATISGLDPASSYYFAVTAYNSAGLESGYSNVAEKKETLAPTVSIASPAAGSQVNGTVPVAVNAADNNAVTGVEFYVNGILQSTVSAAPYAFNWNTSSLGSGNYTISVKAFDAAGNIGEAAVQVAVAGDTTAPAVQLSGPANNETVAGNVTITAAASDNVAVTKVELYDNDVMLFAGNQNPVSYSWDSLAAGNGSHLLTARVFDAAGNTGSASVTVQVLNDLAAPSVAITSPAGGSSVSGTVAVTVSASDDVAVTKVEFYVNDELKSASSAVPYSFNWDTLAVANGAYKLSARAYDAAGNIGSYPGVILNVSNGDSMAPFVAITSQASGNEVSGAVAVVAEATDNVAVSKVEFYLDGVLQATSIAAPYSFNWDTLGVANGTHTVSAKAYDAAGNIGEYPGVTLNVLNGDLAAPTVNLLSPAGDTIESHKLAIRAAAADNLAVTKLEVYLDGALILTSSGPSAYINKKVEVGSHTIMVKGFDAANNMSSISRTVTRIN